jgi:ethanolamine utilization cobalamin adenosyltransferase
MSEQGINMLEAVSCYTDTIFIVTREDMMRAFDVLSSIIEDRVVSNNNHK